jgi:hypothetical protein
MRANDRDLIRGGHYGQRSCEPHSKAEHMAAPTNAALVKITLANAEPSTHDPKRTLVSVQHASPEAFFLTCSTRPPNQVAIVSP